MNKKKQSETPRPLPDLYAWDWPQSEKITVYAPFDYRQRARLLAVVKEEDLKPIQKWLIGEHKTHAHDHDDIPNLVRARILAWQDAIAWHAILVLEEGDKEQVCALVKALEFLHCKRPDHRDKLLNLMHKMGFKDQA